MNASDPSQSRAETALSTLDEVIRDQGSRLTASLAAITGDLQVAEDLVQDAVVVALQRWRDEGIPQQPAAWLFITARNRAIDRLRRESNLRRKLELIANNDDAPAVDERLKLIFTCCHPALSREAQIALTLRTICGLTTSEIARAFLTKESAIAQRLVRARKKISEAGIPYRIPAPEELNERLQEVLSVVYLMFNEGYLASGGERSHRPDLTAEAEWLCRLLSRLMPTEPEVMGLYALVQLHRARARARFDQYGHIVLLRDQDRSLWDRETIEDASRLLVRAAKMQAPGQYQLQAAIIGCHAEAPSWAETDWRQILLLYDALLQVALSPVVCLNRTVAVRYVLGPQLALDEMASLEPELSGYRLFHATKAEFLRELGRRTEADAANNMALSLTENPAERALLEARLR